MTKCDCAVCGKPCEWLDDVDGGGGRYSGWYCRECDCFTSDGIEAAEEE